MKQVFIIAGPNGSGKTTLAHELVTNFGVAFLNADEIAMRLAPGDVQRVRLQAGMEFLEQLSTFIKKGESFAVETTLAGKTFVSTLKQLKKECYEISLFYVYVDSPQEAVKRVKLRVEKGGHDVPEADVVRRFYRSIHNFWHIYQHMVDSCKIYLNSENEFKFVALSRAGIYDIADEDEFQRFKTILSQTDEKERL